MASYTVTGRDNEGSPIVQVSISGIDQDLPLLKDIDVVNAVRAVIASASGVTSVMAQKYEQVITVV